MPTVLTDIALDELSLVDEPANPGATILLTKYEDVPDEVIVQELTSEDDAFTQALIAKDRALAAATSELAKLKDAERTRGLVEKLGRLRHVPGLEPASFAAIYRQLDSDSAATLDRVLKAADAALGQSALFGEVGRSTPDPVGADAYSRLMAAGEEIRKSDPAMTRSQGFARACVDYPDLYLQHIREKRSHAA